MKVERLRCSLRMMVLRVLMAMVVMMLVTTALPAAEYQSLYPLVLDNVDTCLKSPCDGYIRYITAVVGNGVLSGEVQASGEKTLKLKLVSDYYWIPDAFRLFIPPGTLSVSVSISSDGYPDLIYRYNNHELERTARYITVQSRDLGFSGDSGWLYIENTNAVPLRKVDATITVDLAEFVAWYNGPVQWDENGDPWSENSGVVAVESCTDNLDACQESNCQTEGQGYWYNDVEGGEKRCHPEPACGENNYFDCLTESQCASADADLYWYKDDVDGEPTCHPMPACQRDLETGLAVDECTPVNCITSDQCFDAGFFWYEDEEGGEKTCHKLRACESVDPDTEEIVCLADNCITPDQCTSSGFYWYEDVIGEDKYCHPVPACEWNHRDAVEEEACSPSNCITEAQCNDADFYWYEDEAGGDWCHDEPELGVCSQDNLRACITEADCVEAGGEWYNRSACVEKRSSSYTYTPPATSTPPPSTGTGTQTVAPTNWFAAFLSPHSVTVTCDAQHLDACDQSGCESLGNGFWWHDGACRTVACDAQHPEACDQSGCEALGEGFWWYDGSCRTEPVVGDYTGRINRAPVSPGSAADDGIISAGEGLSFRVNVPAGERMYAVLSIPGVGAFFISNDQVFTTDVVPVATGTIPVVDDICPYLPAELMGNWTVYMLAVPASVGESLDELGAYLSQQDALYAFSSYQIDVSCQAAQQEQGLRLLDPLTGSAR